MAKKTVKPPELPAAEVVAQAFFEALASGATLQEAQNAAMIALKKAG